MSAGAGRYDDRNKGYLFLLVVVMIILAWFASTHLLYTMPLDRLAMAYWYALRATPNEPRLLILPIIAAISGFSILIAVNSYYRTNFGGAAYLYKLRGPNMVSPAQLRDITKESAPQLSIAGIPVPIEVESQHLSVVGSTGSGKSQAIAEYIGSALSRNGRIVCIDPNGGFMQSLFQPNDVILNPFDQRGQSWSIFNEIRNGYDVTQFAVTIIPRAPQTEQEQWNSMARTIVSEVMLKLVRQNKGTTWNLTYWLTIATNDQLSDMLGDTAAAGMFHGADETVGSVRAVLTQYITPHKFLSDPMAGEVPFSIRDWLENGSGNLWITWREDMLQSLKPLISCWTDVVCAASLSTDLSIPTKCPVHIIIDEADSLNRLNYIEAVAAKGRKHRLYLVMGFQSYAQLEDNYGRNGAMTLRSCLRSTLSLSIAEMDTMTAEQISLGLGEHEVVRIKKSLSIGGSGAGSRGSASPETVSERMVRPSELHNLPNLTGYLKFAGDIPFARVKIRYCKRPQVVEPLILISNKWTSVIAVEDPPLFENGDAVV